MLIGQLAAATGVTTKALRFYEADGLLPQPDRTAAGYRDYPDAAVDRVTFIRQAQAAGLTLAQIREVLAIRDGGEPPCRHVAGLVDERLEEVTRRLDELERTRTELLALRRRLDGFDPAQCEDGVICSAIPARPAASG
jgi:DNA-binding transcriptional MerR regulator